MKRSKPRGKEYLEPHRGKWRVVVDVPRALHSKLGTKLKRSLGTDSLALANKLKWQVVAEFKKTIEDARGGTKEDALTREAIEIAALRQRVQSDEELEALEDAVATRAEQLAGDPVETQAGLNGPEYIYDPARERTAAEYVALARGEAIPIDLHHERFLSQSHTKARTKGDDLRAVQFLMDWCQRERVRPILQAITPKTAARFIDDLPELTGGLSPVTLKKYRNRLSVYWQWLLAREHVLSNVWASTKIRAPETPHNELEREFSDEEMLRLLNGPAPQRMHDLMRIGALTGARLDAIVDLKVRDVADGLFIFKPQKKEKAPRGVPTHPDLIEIVVRRVEGKKPDDDLFPEWPAPKKEGSIRERSFKASNVFTEYRRAVGVDDVVPGKRRSRVNFHSFRRWFITKAERADQAPSIIAVVVGHKRAGETLGTYSGGPLMAQARRCVEAVRLPLA